MISLNNLSLLNGRSLHVEKVVRIREHFQHVCLVQGMYACCGVGVVSNMDFTKDQFERFSRELYKVVDYNHRHDRGVGAYIATTGNFAGISPEYFKQNKYWEIMQEIENPVHDGTLLQIWILKQ